MIGPTTRGRRQPPQSGEHDRGAAIFGRVVTSAATTLLAVLVITGVSGYLWLGRVRDDPLQRADAVIVLAGAHDGRESYGLTVARQVSAHTLVLSDGYPINDPVMRRACAGPRGEITVICRRAVPASTRGEALLAQRLAAERHWQRIVVVSWSYHLPRARFIFSQCFSNRPGAVMMRAVPHDDPRSLGEWEFISLYQEFALIKAGIEGACG
jgi:uncharacterized SAM-binding protein YcdF (DUF218 family)